MYKKINYLTAITFGIKRLLTDPWSLLSYINIPVREYIISKNASKKKFFFIQIGANNGINNDPIRKYILKYKWKGILVEPQKNVFEDLKYNYRNEKQLLFENCVISEKKGDVIFHTSEQSGLSSLHTDEWFKGKNAGFAYINRKESGGAKKVKVKSLQFMDLVKKHNVKHIDLLQIDTEGYDAKIIKLIDFEKIMPKMIAYEDHHLTPKNRKRLMHFLKAKGYKTIKVGSDSFAYK